MMLDRGLTHINARIVTSGRTATGISQPVRSRGDTQYFAGNSIPFAPADRPSGRALLERGYVAQALIDSTAVLIGFLFIVSFALSFPLAILLLLFARF